MNANASSSGLLRRRILTGVLLVPLIAVTLCGQSVPSKADATAELFRAMRNGDARLWRELLGANRNPDARDLAGNTLLHLAALRGDAEAVDALLERGADAKAVNEAGATPLHYGTGSEQIVTALLARGAPADAVSKLGITPLLAAVSRPDSFAVARRLIEAGARVNHQRMTPRGPHAMASILAIAVSGGDRRTVKLLIEHGANVNPPRGNSPLSAAAYNGDLELVQLLLDHGAEVNYLSGFAGSALNFALHARHYDVARLLIERDADLTSRSTAGHATPPMVWSAYNEDGDASIARLLIGRGIDPNVANDYGETALSYALKRGPDTPLVRFLLESGAKPPTSARAKSIPDRTVPADSTARAAMIRGSVQRAVDLLQRNSTAFLNTGFVRNQTRCVSCHQQALPAVAFGWARERGFHVNDADLGQLLHATLTQRGPQAENARQMDEPTPSADVTIGFDADGLHALGYTGDEMSEAMSHYLLGIQRPDGSWPSHVRRPPMEDGPIVGTAWSSRAVQLYPPSGRKHEVDAALRRARGWLHQQRPQTHNEQVFQLLGLAWAGETPSQMKPLASRLTATQRADGGWSQLPGIGPDAWATGSALIALHKAGISTSDPAYQRGLDFLLRTQFDDGSWWVRSRSWPFQPHFDGQFPHGRDQWISAGGTAWAAMAMLLTVEPSVKPETLPSARTLIAKFVSTRENAIAREESVSSRQESDAMKVSFARDIRPLIERSCAGCHTGEKVKGGFSLASRDLALKGGQSGEPAIVPGRSGESPLLRYIAGDIEDLEMPPLNRREKYPALTADEIALMRAWIEAGAPWPSAPAPSTKTAAASP